MYLMISASWAALQPTDTRGVTREHLTKMPVVVNFQRHKRIRDTHPDRGVVMTNTEFTTQIFYQNNHVFNTLQKCSTSIFLRCITGPLAVLSSARPSPSLLAHDQNHSILTTHSTLETRNINYTPFGYTKSSERGIPAYAGELLDPLCESYLLGKGFRAFSPEINRFKSSDTVPPFEILNYYAYCEGDPINAVGPSGHAKIFVPHSKFDHIRRRLVQETSSVTEYTPSLLENPRTRTHAEASLSLIEKINTLDGKRLYQSSRIVNAKNKLESARRVLAEAYQ
ncbi:hypothetical protein AL532_09595 [Pseudomonas monteilii]|uniref:RHS repeat-associated core domain-containing protein n=1 Tax=Pseudomonas kurunegalensis TaxID=485880 RepID=A0ACC5UJ12_9PSED|nr:MULTISPECIES: RHS repeat-associated core domain-containing protein [Pseudomonas]AVH36545.1 hypothetical protein AL532_09595 [Pseudomonas monteilii]MBV4514438.1 RHS repeat-associated core domain-containing protein [Pseudomonas kurunegalensis]